MNIEQLRAEFEVWRRKHYDYEDLTAFEIKFAFAAFQAGRAALQSPEVQAWKRDAELYRWVKNNIKEGYEFDGGYYISDEDTSNWDRTIRAAMEQQK